tara:strand:- start:2863 stop:3660 length:798 start_codon:yes stop_codon:yes gene_type:complete
MINNKEEISKTATKVLFGIIPYIGDALDEVVFEHRSRIKQNRINQFVESFKEFYKSLNIKQVKIDDIKSEEFGDVFEAILRSVANNRSKHKIEHFKNILANQIQHANYTDFTETYLDIVSKLNEVQISILKSHNEIKTPIEELTKKEEQLTETIKKLKKIKEGLIDKAKIKRLNKNESIAEKEYEIAKSELERKKIQDSIKDKDVIRNSEFYSLKQGDYIFYIQDLVSKSLLVDEGIGKHDYKPYRLMTISEFGKKFLEFLEYKV